MIVVITLRRDDRWHLTIRCECRHFRSVSSAVITAERDDYNPEPLGIAKSIQSAASCHRGVTWRVSPASRKSRYFLLYPYTEHLDTMKMVPPS